MACSPVPFSIFFALDELSHLEGTGTFGRVRLVRHLDNGKFYALKISKKASIIRMKQVRVYVFAFVLYDASRRIVGPGTRNDT